MAKVFLLIAPGPQGGTQASNSIAAAKLWPLTIDDLENPDVVRLDGYGTVPAITLDRVEEILTTNLLTKDLMHEHPDFDHTYYAEVAAEKTPMTFDRDVYDLNPEVGFMTYGHPIFRDFSTKSDWEPHDVLGLPSVIQNKNGSGWRRSRWLHQAEFASFRDAD